MKHSIYSSIPDNFYDDLGASKNPIARAYHQHRYAKIRTWLAEKNLQKGKILDIGCGQCTWNTEGYDITGFDISKKHLDAALAGKRITSAVLGDFGSSLPFPSGSFDAVIMTEVLEHLENPAAKAREISRVLKKGGYLIVTVPFDSLLSVWKPLCYAQCLYMGWIRGQEIFRMEMGHINHFSPRSLSLLLESSGFKTISIDPWLRYNLSALAMKP